MLLITGPKAQFVARVLNSFSEQHYGNIVMVVETVTGQNLLPAGVVDLRDTIDRAVRQIRDHETLPEQLLPLAKRAILSERRRIARELETRKAAIINPELLREIEDRLRPYEECLSSEVFATVAPLQLQRLTDFLTLDRVERVFAGPPAPARVLDDKFQILQSPMHFLSALAHLRHACELRRLPIGVAFIDIDDFKKNFNTPHGEPMVDRFVLPQFMSALEAHFYFHGDVFKFGGGDEYLVILPNATLESAAALLHSFQERMRGLSFVNIPAQITLSIGLCIADADCHLTELELRDRAAKAKDFAKREGKDRIAAFAKGSYQDGSLYIWSPPVKQSS